MDILTLKSKEKLGCNMCDKCCIYRGDIKLIPVNVCRISKFLNISINEFLDKYTDSYGLSKLELVLKTTGDLKECILYNKEITGCGIHPVKPMQCVIFPLVPENLKRDYFVNSNQCVLEDAREITVNEWLNGNNNIYKKNKNICIEWIKFIEWAEEKTSKMNDDEIRKIRKILFENYNLKNPFYKLQMKRNLHKAEKLIIEICK
jgi:Fe-S-cluster containining protein